MKTDPTFLDATTQKEVIACLLERLKRNYIYPEHVEQIATHLVDSMEQGEFTDLDDPNLFALALTLHLPPVRVIAVGPGQPENRNEPIRVFQGAVPVVTRYSFVHQKLQSSAGSIDMLE